MSRGGRTATFAEAHGVPTTLQILHAAFVRRVRFTECRADKTPGTLAHERTGAFEFLGHSPAATPHTSICPFLPFLAVG